MSLDSSLSPPSYVDLVSPDMLYESRQIIKRKLVKVVDEHITVKLGPGVTEYEFRALEFIHSLKTIPCPKPIRFFNVEDCNVIIMSTVIGQTLSDVGYKMSFANRSRLIADVERILTEANLALLAQGIGPPVSGCISDLDGRQCMQLPLLDGYLPRPVNITLNSSEAPSFEDSMSLATPVPPSTENTMLQVLRILAPRSESLRLCHMDLHTGNIIVREGKIAGIIDWEMCGWYTKDIEFFAALRHFYFSSQWLEELTASWNIHPDIVEAAKTTHWELERKASEQRSKILRAAKVAEFLANPDTTGRFVVQGGMVRRARRPRPRPHEVSKITSDSPNKVGETGDGKSAESGQLTEGVKSIGDGLVACSSHPMDRNE